METLVVYHLELSDFKLENINRASVLVTCEKISPIPFLIEKKKYNMFLKRKRMYGRVTQTSNPKGGLSHWLETLSIF